MNMLVYRVSNTVALSMFTAFRIKKAQLIVGPLPSGVAQTITPPIMAWDTSGTSGVDVKPSSLVPMLSDAAHSTSVTLVPPPKSTLGFWQDDPTTDPFLRISGPNYGANAPLMILDLWVDYTLTDPTNTTQSLSVGSITVPQAQRTVAGSSTSSAAPVGWAAYT